MKIGVLSDTHNNRSNLQWAVGVLHSENITTIIHCGDLILPDMLALLKNFQIIFLFGNGDTETAPIRTYLSGLHPDNSCSYVFTGSLGGVSISATHGHLPGKVDELSRSGDYRFVFHGHSHRRKDELNASTRVVNPGALGGLKPQERSFCIADLESQTVEFKLMHQAVR